MKAKQLGELMQVDYMSVSFTEGFNFKEFKVTGPSQEQRLCVVTLEQAVAMQGAFLTAR